MIVRKLTDSVRPLAEDGELEALRNVLTQRPKLISAQDEFGWTLLHRAAQFGHHEVVHLLLSMGANPNRKDFKGMTPLYNAIFDKWQSLSSLSLLVQAGADVNARKRDGETPLIAAARYSNLPATSFLLGAGADSNAKSRRGNTALAEACLQFEAFNENRKHRQQCEDLRRIIEVLEVRRTSSVETD